MFVVRADLERSIKILRHRSDVCCASIALVIPARDGQRDDFLQYFARLHRREVLFHIPVARTDEGAVDVQVSGTQTHQLGAAPGVAVSVIMSAASIPWRSSSSFSSFLCSAHSSVSRLPPALRLMA